jgi:hypothetical protein
VVAAEELAEAPRHRREDCPRGREGEPRRDVEPRRDDRARGRDDRPRRRDDDLGPAVRGFGDSIPAFMLIAIPKPRRDRAAEIEAELLPPPAMAAEIIAEPMADSAAPHVMAQAPTEAG